MGGGVRTRTINFKPDAADPNWGLTGDHVVKHVTGNSEYALNVIDPGGTTDVWLSHIQELASRPATATLSNGVEDIVGTFPRSDGTGTFQFGIRISPNGSGSFDLVTLLTKQ